jgi:hypothetical protein
MLMLTDFWVELLMLMLLNPLSLAAPSMMTASRVNDRTSACLRRVCGYGFECDGHGQHRKPLDHRLLQRMYDTAVRLFIVPQR